METSISLHTVLHSDVNCCQFHELESFESAQQMLGKCLGLHEQWHPIMILQFIHDREASLLTYY